MKQTGIGTRVLSFVIDTLIIFLITFILFKVWRWYVMYYRFTPYNFWIFFAIVLVIYYTVLESIFARTPGKWFSYSKVVTKDGKKPSFPAILLRSIVRLTIIDMFFIPFLDKTLHDYISKTEVVEV